MTHPKADGLDALKREVFNAVDANPYIHGVDALAVADFVFDHLAQRGMILQEGWVAVPREPTMDMMDAALKSAWDEKDRSMWQKNAYIYAAMIAAAPKMEGME